jgi:PleD family two-component response regulator
MNTTSLHSAAVRATANHLAQAVLSANSLLAWGLGVASAGAIAIVDDDKWVLKSLERLVKSAGFRVETFLCAEDFLQARDNSTTLCVILACLE